MPSIRLQWPLHIWFPLLAFRLSCIQVSGHRRTNGKLITSSGACTLNSLVFYPSLLGIFQSPQIAGPGFRTAFSESVRGAESAYSSYPESTLMT